MAECAYCGAAASEPDHLINKNQARGNPAASRSRDLSRYIVPACHDCNMRKLTFHRVPWSHEHLIPELEAITGHGYTVWDGDPKTLHGAA